MLLIKCNWVLNCLNKCLLSLQASLSPSLYALINYVVHSPQSPPTPFKLPSSIIWNRYKSPDEMSSTLPPAGRSPFMLHFTDHWAVKLTDKRHQDFKFLRTYTSAFLCHTHILRKRHHRLQLPLHKLLRKNNKHANYSVVNERRIFERSLVLKKQICVILRGLFAF